MDKVIFLIVESEQGGYVAKGMGISIFTQADTLDKLRRAMQDAIRCHNGPDTIVHKT